METYLPEDLMIYEVIMNLNPDELVNFCETGFKCDKKIMKDKLLTSIDTNYNLAHFNVKQLLLFYQMNKLHQRMTVTPNNIYTIENNEIYVFNTSNNQRHSVNTGTVYFYQIITPSNLLYGIDIYGNFYSMDGDGNITTALLKNVIKIVKLDYDYPYMINNALLKLKYKNKFNMNLIDINGNCYVVDDNFNERKIGVKNVIQKKGIFVLNKFGDVYIELNNGYIYNPITNKYINFNKYFHLSPFSNYKYKKLNVNNIKQVTIYGDMLDNDGNIHTFDWNTSDIQTKQYQHVVQIEHFILILYIYLFYMITVKFMLKMKK